MKYVDEFRNRKLITAVAGRIADEIEPGRTYRFMEVCGTHTMGIFRYGLRDLLPDAIELLSGPGCPVCVTPNSYLDTAIALARRGGIVIATFGDMLRVPGSRSSLEREKAAGAAVRVVYSTTDALDLARARPDREVVFLGVGFETTVPTVARAILDAKRERLANFSVLCGHKTMPEALRALAAGAGLAIDGFLLPGHVSAVIGARAYAPLASRRRIACVIAGFEPLDIMQAVLMLVRQSRRRRPAVEIQYARIVRPEGNAVARAAIRRVFGEVSAEWRGIGRVARSGLAIRPAYAAYDAAVKFAPISVPRPREDVGCICGDVLKGARRPPECRLFGRRCTPDHPVGSCMVSGEGTCAAYFRYMR